MLKKLLFAFLTILLSSVTITGCSKDDKDSEDGSINKIDLSRDLLVWITFDDGACNDISGHHYDGVAIGHIEYVNDTPNGNGKAVRIDGTQQQYINIPYELMPDSSNFTLSGWFKNFGPGALFTSIGGYVTAPSLHVTPDGKLKICFYGDSFRNPSGSITEYQSAGWHLITVTGNNDKELSIYIDGKKTDNLDVGAVRTAGKKLQIGGNAESNLDYWADPMLVDNVRVYGRCINENEVKALYEQESGRNGGKNEASTTRGLLAYYTFDDGTANNTYLSSAHGMLTGEASLPTFITDTPNGSGKALQLLSKEYINIATDMMKTKHACSVGLWVKDFGTGALFTSIGGFVCAPSFYINSDSQPYIYFYGDSRRLLKSSLEAYQATGWHHIFVTMEDDKGISIYVDGTKTDNISIGAVRLGGTKIQIGGNGDKNFNDWADPMKIDNVRIHSVALTDAEIRAIYQEEKK